MKPCMSTYNIIHSTQINVLTCVSGVERIGLLKLIGFCYILLFFLIAHYKQFIIKRIRYLYPSAAETNTAQSLF